MLKSVDIHKPGKLKAFKNRVYLAMRAKKKGKLDFDIFYGQFDVGLTDTVGVAADKAGEAYGAAWEPLG